MKKIVDGNGACSRIAYLFSEVCSIYPITPSSPMASNIDLLTTSGLLNLFNDVPKVLEMESEAGAAGAFHGALLSGSLSTTFTASQGLLLMIPNMYKIAGEMLPGVIHVASRSLATHALSIFGDHQDIYAVRSTGFCILASSSVEDAQNLAAVAHLSAIKGSLPFIHFFDGFRTSHELNTIDEIKDEELLKLVDKDALKKYKDRCLNVGNNLQYGMAENEDIYFQCTEARNNVYNEMPDIVNEYMKSINKITNRDYLPFNYYGSKTAKNIIIAMGSVTDTIKLVLEKRDDIGLIEVHLYRPFSREYLLNVLPSSVKNIAVLDRTKEAGGVGEPLYLDVCAILKDKNINIVGGRYGLSSKNTTPEDIMSVYDMLDNELKNNFTIGITDDVTNLSLEKKKFLLNSDCKEIKIFGFGSDGMVSASKDLLKIVHKSSNKFVQGYFLYDSKKSGGVTVSNLRISDAKINMPFYVTNPEIVVVTKDIYFRLFSILDSISTSGVLLINTSKNEDELKNLFTNEVKKVIMEKNIKVYFIDAEDISVNAGIKGKINKIIEVLILKLLKINDADEIVINSVRKDFATKGEKVINSNIDAINESLSKLKTLNTDFVINEKTKIVDEDVVTLINARKGNELPVSKLMEYSNGSFKFDNTKNEKRGISNVAPFWVKESCIQCGMCSLVCPHGVIKSVVSSKEDGIPFTLKDELNYAITVSKEDCTGCGLCTSVCPGKNGEKALVMKNINEINNNIKALDIKNPLNKFTIKGSQLEDAKFKFSGACAGCGETPYIKLLTQLFGEELVIANATGCSSIYGGSVPSTPYSVPWANSLFEDNAEFALGIHISYKQKRDRIEEIMKKSIDSVDTLEKELFNKWIDNKEDFLVTTEIKNKLKDKMIPNELKELLDYVPARTVWAIGGDGWAYDIGYGGLDHVLHSNENIKVLVLDTEVYSNTGGQASKSTKLGAVAEFANFGKKTIKKDLFRIATSIPNCYVASISLGANMMQAIKAFEEASKHDGPAIIIAYSPCIEHGIKTGMCSTSAEEKLAVEVGYTLLMRYDQTLKIDYLKPNFDDYDKFLDNEVRFNALKIKDAELAKKILNEQKENAIKRFNYYKSLI
ncbi:MAG: pyruvate:ferredoxin (flavodoxin) oxidoreductase [Bacilli bacterium]